MSADDLANLLDSLAEISVYVIEESTHRLLYFNKRCRDTSRGKAALGAKCHEVWPESCENCPLAVLKAGRSGHIVCYDPLLEETVDITANRVMWEGHIEAVVVTAAPHRLDFEEEQGLRKIERMYAQSLMTIFDECVIANLTTDFYVNCQKNAIWTDIPERGHFGIENQSYAERMLHPDDLERFHEYFSREAMLRFFGEGKKQITKMLRRLSEGGDYHYVEFHAAKIDQFGAEECWCVLAFRDIHEEYLLERQRGIAVSQLATAAKIAYQMLIAVNLTQNSYQMLEYERFPIKCPDREGSFDDLIEFELATVHPDFREEFTAKFSRNALTSAYSNGERIVTMEVPHLGEDGIYHWDFVQVVRVENSHTDDMIEITLSRNIDEERRLREAILEKERRAKQILVDALQKAEKASRAKSEFLSRMSHDIRTPMNAIVGMTELAKAHIGNEEKIKDYLDKIAGSGAHLLGLINEVLDVEKIECGAVELEDHEFSLRDLMKNTVEMVRLSMEKKHQTLTVDIDGNLHCQVRGDVRRLQQILVNILENASKYTGDKGRINFSLRELKNNVQNVGAYQFVIEDNGMGMKPEYLEHIFEPFSRADDGRVSRIIGTGLGMTIVKNLITIMGGTIQVESEFGKGSRFLITLCLNKCEASSRPKLAKRQIPQESFSGFRILLAEDNEINRQIAGEMLELIGADVEMVNDGQKAVDAVRSHPPGYYDVVFMDIQMPKLNGYEATKEIRNSGMDRAGELPIIAMTADAFAEDVKLARLAGMNGHLAKPISIEQLKSTLSDCLVWKTRNQ